MVKKAVVICFLTVFFILFHSKLSVGYERVPSSGEILDERITLLSSSSFMRTGIPTGWSNLSAYQISKVTHKDSLLTFDGTSINLDGQKPTLNNIKSFSYPILATSEIDLVADGKRQISFVQPFFDHPPLAGIIYLLSVKGTTMDKLNPKEYRFLPAKIIFWLNATLISILTYLITRKHLPGVFSFLIYATAPSFVFSARYALLENVLIPLTLLNLVLLLLFKRNRKTSFLVLTGITTGLSLATKESGIAVFLMTFAILITCKLEKKRYLYFLIPSLFIGIFFYLYFFLISPSLFSNIFLNQTGRQFFGPLNFYTAISNLNFLNFPQDNFWLFGFISVFILAVAKKYQELTFGFLATLIVYLFFAGLNYPWYSLPFIPFLAISLGIILWETIKDLNPIYIVLLFALPLSSAFYWGYYISSNPTTGLLIYRLALFVVLFLLVSRNKFYKRVILLTILFAIFLLNIRSITYMTQNWGPQLATTRK